MSKTATAKTAAATCAAKSIPVLTGAAIPLGALRTKKSCGVGEYPDLTAFADFCKKSGLGIIQLLPVNDTGTESSPYSALSAFALHPLYARLQDFPESACVKEKIAALAAEHEKNKRFLYRALCEAKLALLREMYEKHADKIAENPELCTWITQNDWIISYAVFMELKRKHRQASWKEWKSERLSQKQITDAWNNTGKKKEHLFFAWLQMRLEQQFQTAAQYVKNQGILLKGDIPILMNEDSCDIWANPAYFSETFRAGAPVDAQNPTGQNWGFPIYNWENHKKNGYSWWKNRLEQASKFYGAYRIDHVLGFFRIWAVPETDYTAVLGHPEPCEPITAEELRAAGFDEGRIHWLSRPHMATSVIACATGGNYDEARRQLSAAADRIGNEELWLFKNSIRGERDLAALPIENGVKNLLYEFWRNRTLIELENGRFVPAWTYKQTNAWRALGTDEKNKLAALFAEKDTKMEKLWKNQAETILGELTAAVSMIACAEDLGAGLECMPEVLRKLGILSLRVLRWTRDWQKNGQPFVPVSDYPFLSVTTLSVHDSSTARLWWLEEGDAQAFTRAFPPENANSARNPQLPADVLRAAFTPETAAYLLETAATSASAFCVHPLQDFLYLDGQYYDTDSKNERINIPGSVTEFNWTYRLPDTIENLLKNEVLCQKICTVAQAHIETTQKKLKEQ